MEVRIGQKWRMDVGGKPVIVVGFDDGLVLVKSADESKKNLARAAGGRLTSKTEMQSWTLLEDTATTRDP